MDQIRKNLLKQVAEIEEIPKGAYNFRIDGEKFDRKCTENIDIVSKEDGKGIEIHVKPNTKNESIHIPVLITMSGLHDVVYNEFYIGENSDVLIVAGCGIHNASNKDSQHDGIHSFFLEKNAKVKYIEKHYGEGDGDGKRILNPVTNIELLEGSSLEMQSIQIKGVTSTVRETNGILNANSSLVISEKIFSSGEQKVVTIFNVNLKGENSSVHVTSRSVAEGNSYQEFKSSIEGNNICFGHVECDAIIKDNGSVRAIPEIIANNVGANLIHEAAIGKIAGEQIIKLMTLGLSEKEAEETIISGFLK